MQQCGTQTPEAVRRVFGYDIERRQRYLEAEIRSLRKQLAQKDEVIEILKKSVGILSEP